MRHQTISFIKSFYRIGGYLLLLYKPWFSIAVMWLVVSEMWGVMEEIGHE